MMDQRQKARDSAQRLFTGALDQALSRAFHDKDITHEQIIGDAVTILRQNGILKDEWGPRYVATLSEIQDLGPGSVVIDRHNVAWIRRENRNDGINWRGTNGAIARDRAIIAEGPVTLIRAAGFQSGSR